MLKVKMFSIFILSLFIVWFATLEISDKISIIATIVSAGIAIWSIYQNHCYKKQADEFSDLQFMPEFFFASEDGYIENASPCIPIIYCYGYGGGHSLGKYVAFNTPIYAFRIVQIKIDSVVVSKNAQCNAINIYPTDPTFEIKVSIPDNLARDNVRHKGTVLFTYENMYGTKYKKEISFIIQNNRIHSREMKYKRAERCNNGQTKI